MATVWTFDLFICFWFFVKATLYCGSHRSQDFKIKAPGPVLGSADPIPIYSWCPVKSAVEICHEGTSVTQSVHTSQTWYLFEWLVDRICLSSWYDSHMCRRQQPAIWVSIFVGRIHNYKPSVGVLCDTYPIIIHDSPTVVIFRANTSICPRLSAAIFVCAENVVKIGVFCIMANFMLYIGTHSLGTCASLLHTIIIIIIKPLLKIFNECRSLTGVVELSPYWRSSMNVEV